MFYVGGTLSDLAAEVGDNAGEAAVEAALQVLQISVRMLNLCIIRFNIKMYLTIMAGDPARKKGDVFALSHCSKYELFLMFSATFWQVLILHHPTSDNRSTILLTTFIFPTVCSYANELRMLNYFKMQVRY